MQVEASSPPQPDNKESSGMVETSSTQPDGKKSSEMVEASPPKPDGQEVSDEMGEATSTESDVQTENLDRKESSEIVEDTSTQPDKEEISERAMASSTQPDSKKSNEMVKAGSTQLDSQGVSEMVEVASTQSDGKKMGEIVEAASTQPDGEEGTKTDESASTQSDNKESTETVKATSTQSDIQIKIEERRKKLAESLDNLKKELKNLVSEKKVDFKRYRPLVKAIYDKDVKGIEDFININNDPEALLDAQIDEFGSTIFHLIVRVPGTDALIEKLVSMARPDSLERKNTGGCTALHSAAMIGNKKAVKLFVKRNRKLLSLKDNDDFLPADWAVYTGRKETAAYLHLCLYLEKEFDEEFLEDRAYVLYRLIEANNTDLALGFLNRYPELANRHQNEQYWNPTLNELARKDMGLPRGTWQRLIYYYIPMKTEKHNSTSEHKDIENQIQTSQKRYFSAKLQCKLWNALWSLVPGFKCIHDRKLLHEQTLEMVRLMIADVTWSFEEALESLKEPMFVAAMLGNHRFVEEILKAYPYSYVFYDEHGHTTFHLAVLHRQENVFNLIYNQVSFVKDRIWMFTDDTDSNILHLAGRLVLSNEIPGAALQMQRELQWFKIVENIFHPKLKVARNFDGKTPREVFTEEHKILVKEGEKWMKETGAACSVVAALIITVVFATAYTFPGGLNGEGLPNFLPKKPFRVFLGSIILALFSSAISLQMFLGIVTSRYAEEDFLESLPKKLIIGLTTLFFSSASMLVAFTATFQIFLRTWKWVTFVMVVLVFVPVTLFALMQFPLLLAIYKSTYWPSILRPMR